MHWQTVNSLAAYIFGNKLPEAFPFSASDPFLLFATPSPEDFRTLPTPPESFAGTMTADVDPLDEVPGIAMRGFEVLGVAEPFALRLSDRDVFFVLVDLAEDGESDDDDPCLGVEDEGFHFAFDPDAATIQGCVKCRVSDNSIMRAFTENCSALQRS
ncbi:hypothetical protein HDU97_007526 [Phlyctochytrium planicorne]|nr:hypothetical protein HDU97_007526 [Phlyctochytrium planicorne]